ncbi:protein GLUTAMINE DUMPER 3 [Gastrolobium bilobum]|uniref:protein GLUTAMINE DUMPER 3 n=1 Tax=Gastrolobium bilobum TaxID=150636 RepID=UPI002AB3178C|nr:protein GLUTAMINE DUMPER 3 [Gastrolobium bilobum]
MAAYREPMDVNERAPFSSQPPHSPWHSPVPYLFGGLAAMLGLIAFALLILACSYWKLSGYLEGNGESERDLEAGEGKTDQNQKPQRQYEEKILVIMAGQEKPTFLATPSMSSGTSASTSRSSSFGENTSTCTCDQTEKSVEMAETMKQGSGGNDQVRSENRENPDTSADQNC